MNPQFLTPPEITGDPQPSWPPLVALTLLVLVIVGLTIVYPSSSNPTADAFVRLALTNDAPPRGQPSFQRPLKLVSHPQPCSL
jgi:hypothetical protein